MTTVTASEWVRVSSRNRCPVCGKSDWCMVSQDGTAAICARIESDRPAGKKGAGWVHKLTEDRQPLPVPQRKETIKQLPLAPIERRNQVYTALLTELTLTEAHLSNLLKRGLTEDHIQHLQYKSMPTDSRRTAVHQLIKSGLKLGGVPGFWLHNGQVRLCGQAGILIPVREIQGRIQGCQIRLDEVNQGGKYRWLSSASKPYGTGSGAPVHVVRPEGAKIGEVWVTEGALKADIASLKLKRTVLAVAGVGNWAGVIPIVKALRPERVIVAYDMDRNANQTVRCYEVELIRALLRLKIKVFEASWNQSSKGLDDFILSQEHSA